ncbi:MAG: acetamidase/formamidase family protein [Limnochordia bacterium]
MKFISPETYCYELGTSVPPIAQLKVGQVYRIATNDSRTGRLRKAEDVLTSVPKPVGDNPMVNPATGPFAIEGAEVGDTLVVEIVDIQLGDQGYLMAKEGQGLLGPEAKQTMAKIVPVKDNMCHFAPDIIFPVRPMVGVIGTAPKDKPVPTIHVGDTGGNMDNHLITTGTKVFLPVEVAGAYLFIGDVHAAMGDGEISGTALEVQAEVTFTVDLIKGQSTPLPYLETETLFVTTGHGPTFPEAARQAVHDMGRRLVEGRGLTWEDAMMLLSAIGDLRICQSCGHPLEVTVRMEIPKEFMTP